MRRLRSWLVVAIAITGFFALAPGRTLQEADRPITVQRPAIDEFAVGWYSGLHELSALTDIAGDGATVVMPYHSPTADVARYLRTAERAGLKVLLEIDRKIVKDGSTSKLRRFVDEHKDAPALFGWYLADEPTTTVALGPLSDERATKLYRAIKQADPDHPVAIAFHASEDIRDYASAMDIVMFDNYPFLPETKEFAALPGWWRRLTARAVLGRGVGGFVPILQAFGGHRSPSGVIRRFPTGAEMRYMTFASLEAGATGIFFWAHYRTDPRWADDVLVPITGELRDLGPALRGGTLETATSVDRRDVGLTMFHDPETGSRYLVVVHHGNGDVEATIRLDAGLQGSHVERTDGRPVRVTRDEVVTTLGPFGAQVLRMGPA